MIFTAFAVGIVFALYVAWSIGYVSSLRQSAANLQTKNTSLTMENDALRVLSQKQTELIAAQAKGLERPLMTQEQAEWLARFISVTAVKAINSNGPIVLSSGAKVQ